MLALGDSLTAGYGLPQGRGFAPRLEARLRERGRDVHVIDAGVSGDTTAGGLARLDWLLDDPQGRPHLVILELGANDALRGLPPERAEGNLDAMLARCVGQGIRVVLAGMLAPLNLGPEYGARFNPIYPRLAARHGVALYPFFLEGVAGKPELNLADGLHPNERGVGVIVEGILPLVERELDALP